MGRRVDIEAQLGTALGRPVRVARAVLGAETGSLTHGEQLQYDAIGSADRQRRWRLGRMALRQLLDEGSDTSMLSFPHPALSLSHAGEVALAVRIDGVRGTGIDLEPTTRPMDARAARFFMHPDETGHKAAASLPLLQLWTVKEALFKATPDNAESVLAAYRLDDSAASVGSARGPRGEQLKYASIVLPDGYVTVAACLGLPGDDAAARPAR